MMLYIYLGLKMCFVKRLAVVCIIAANASSEATSKEK